MKFMSVLFLAITMTSCSHKDNDHSPSVDVSTVEAKAMMEGKASGSIYIKPTSEGLVVNVLVTGLKANTTHGMHIHEKGVCDAPSYKTAGDHFNPGKHSHGSPAGTIKHLGDLGNITSNDKGVAEKEIILSDIKDAGIIENRSIIIHANADDFTTQPSGNSGDRISCGIITLNN